jgi:hypothetical protein
MGRWLNTETIRNWFPRQTQRGAAVPFEAPVLRMARVCDDDRDGLIAVLRDFANNGAAYIVPWKSLPLMAAMTDHDLAIHGAINETRASSPAQVRATISRLALSGALGPEAKAQENRRALAETDHLADIEMILIVQLLTDCGTGGSKLPASPAGWSDADVRAAVATAAAAVGLNRREIYRRIGEFSRLLAPVGLKAAPGTTPSGWLRVLHAEIDAFGQTLCAAAPRLSSDGSAHLAMIAEAGRRTARLSGLVFDALDYAALDIAGTIRRWDAEVPVLRQSIERLSSLLDEWPALMKLAHDALRAPPEAAAAQLRVVRSMLPRLPDGDPAGQGDAPAGCPA